MQMVRTFIKALLLCLSMLILVACNKGKTDDFDWKAINRLMESRCDSAYRMLEQIDTDELNTSSDKACYALLMTEAKEKNYIKQTNDSLIRTAVRYFKANHKGDLYAKSVYLYACVLRNQSAYPQAIQQFNIAKSMADEANAKELVSKIYSNIAYIYYSQNMDVQADSVYCLAESLAIEEKDTVGLIFAISQRGMIGLAKGTSRYSSAESQILRALDLADAYGDQNVKIPIYSSLATLYETTGDYRKAIHYALLECNNVKDSAHCYEAFASLGNAYFELDMPDSSSYYLHKVLSAERYFQTKAKACRLLSLIAEKRNDVYAAMDFKNKVIAYQDSSYASLQKSEIIEGELIDKKQALEHSIRYNYRLFIILVCGIIVFSSILIYLKIRRSHSSDLSQRTDIDLELCTNTYTKLLRISRQLSKVEIEENISVAEWNLLKLYIDWKHKGVLSFIERKYALTDEEIQICTLYVAEVPVTHMGHFIGNYARSTIQLKAKNISEKIGGSSGEILKHRLNQITSKLK